MKKKRWRVKGEKKGGALYQHIYIHRQHKVDNNNLFLYAQVNLIKV